MPVHIYLNKWHDEARFQFCFILKECVSVSHLHFQPIFFLSSLKKKVIDPNRILISYPNIEAPLNLQLYTASFWFFFGGGGELYCAVEGWFPNHWTPVNSQYITVLHPVTFTS